MTFTRPLFLITLLLVAYFGYLGRPRGRYGRGRAWAALILRCFIVSLVVLSLAGVRSVHGGDELTVVFAVDVSESVTEAEQERALTFVKEALAEMPPGDQAAVILFGADALVERPMTGSRQLGEVVSIPRTHQTDLEEAIRLGLALFPAGAARRMVILSDGRPTTGDAEAAIYLTRAEGVQVDVVSLGTPLDAEVRLSELDLPSRLHQGEEFTLSPIVESTTQTDARLTILSGGRVAAQETVRLSPGRSRFAVPLAATEPGFTSYRAVLDPVVDTYPQNNALSAFALVEGPPRVLIAARDDADARPLREALRASGLDVAQSASGALPSDPAALAEYAAVVLANTPAQELAPRAMETLRSFVRDLGGGLVAVGGPESYGVGGWYETPLEETLPVKMTIDDPQRFPPMSIVVIMDKSGSMATEEEGIQKIRLAGEAAARVAELITDLDEITVIAFDDRPADVIGPLPGSRRDEAIERVTRLQAGGGGIWVREALETALEHLAGSDRPVRHILLLADGSDSEHQAGVPQLVEEEIAGQNITLSTVAIGAGKDLGFLERIAELGGGRYHFTDRAANLPLIFAQETQLAMRSYVVEEPFFPRQVSSSPMLTGIEAAPRLTGYVATTPKSAAQVVLSTHQDDPLLATWQYGLGRAVAWTSDATGRWAQRWIEWEDFARFWAQVVRWTIAQRTDLPVEVAVSLEGETAHVRADAVDEEGAFINGLEATLSLVGPEGGVESIELAQTAPGRYEGTFTPQVEGAYLLRLTGRLEAEVVIALTTGWALGYSPEYAALEADPDYLGILANLGGGRVLEEPSQAFAHTLRGEGTTQELWPYLMGLATLLLPLDIAVRRLALGREDLARAWAWLLERMPRRAVRPAAEAPSPVSRLLEAKERVERPLRSAGAPPPSPGPPQPEHTTQPTPEPSRPSVEEETLAGRLLRSRRRREEERNNQD